ncbi:MAG TPA: ROK family protein [Thermomicrobiales bacterium]|nr:ROK family protein [Thermomicrobiales bacterium]
MARFAIGVDFGGTKVLAAVVNVDSGKVVGTGKNRTSASDGPDELMERIYSTCDAALKDAKRTGKDLEAIGIGIAGQVDPDSGILVGTANLSRSVVDLPIAKHIEDRYGVKAALRNDVHIAAIGEARFGAGKGIDDFLCVFVGTGIGGAIVRGGELVRGATGNAGELGHTMIQVDGRICGCGGRGHLEAYASRTAITNALMGELRRGQESILTELMPDVDPARPSGAAIRSGVLKKAMAAKDEVTLRIVLSAGEYLGLGLASIVNFLNPTRIILGGGVIEAVDVFFETAARITRRESFPSAGSEVEIVRAALGDNSGVIGAAVIAAES